MEVNADLALSGHPEVKHRQLCSHLAATGAQQGQLCSILRAGSTRHVHDSLLRKEVEFQVIPQRAGPAAAGEPCNLVLSWHATSTLLMLGKQAGPQQHLCRHLQHLAQGRMTRNDIKNSCLLDKPGCQVQERDMLWH